MRIRTSAHACVYGYKCVSACRYMRAYMYVRACVRVSVRLVCVFVYVYVRDYSYVLLLTSNIGVHAFACTPIDQHRC